MVSTIDIPAILEARYLLTILICIKVLLIPCYKSTDFDVHRNWLAITRHLPISEWYFTDLNGTTVHTLDYPPLFAFFEYFLSNNFVTNYLVNVDNNPILDLDSRCLALLPDTDNEVGYNCVVFQRCTVILSDAVFWIGAWYLAHSLFYKPGSSKLDALSSKGVCAFALTVCNPGLLLLDHIHFQYNGMLLGMLMGSLALLLRGLDCANQPRLKSGIEAVNNNIRLVDILGAVLFAVLLNFKHLYLILAPAYFVYLLRKVCYLGKNTRGGEITVTLSPIRFIFMGIIVLPLLILPFVPFVMSYAGKGTSVPNEIRVVISQIFSRLFPFSRGLVHDYWAGNVWALYLTLEKAIGFAVRLAKKFVTVGGGVSWLTMVTDTIEYYIYPLPAITPFWTLYFSLNSLIPGIICAWKIASIQFVSNPTHASTRRRESLLYVVVFSAMSNFMAGYHVHEKAIMTCIIPLGFLAVTSRDAARLYLRLSALGHFGLLPLLFRSEELILKVVMNVAFFAGSVYVLEGITSPPPPRNTGGRGLLTKGDKVRLVLMALLLLFTEVIHPFVLGDRPEVEFLPLMLTSAFCAVGLFGCWIETGRQMIAIVRGL